MALKVCLHSGVLEVLEARKGVRAKTRGASSLCVDVDVDALLLYVYTLRVKWQRRRLFRGEVS